MDASTVISAAVAFLAPYTPQLLELGKKGAEEIAKTLAKKGTEAGWDKATRLWGKLTARFKDDQKVIKTTELLAVDPADKDSQTQLAALLTKRLGDDPALIEELAGILGGPARVQEMIAGDNSLLLAVQQRMGSGGGRQTMKAGGGGEIIGAEQSIE